MFILYTRSVILGINNKSSLTDGVFRFSSKTMSNKEINETAVGVDMKGVKHPADKKSQSNSVNSGEPSDKKSPSNSVNLEQPSDKKSPHLGQVVASWRFVISLLFHFAIVVLSLPRMSLPIAIICMSEPQAQTTDNSSVTDNHSLTLTSPVPGQNVTQGVQVGCIDIYKRNFELWRTALAV